MSISKKLHSRFIKDYSLPIPVTESPYFDYFINLYDDLYNTIAKFDVFKTSIAKYKNEQLFFEQYNRIKDKIITAIKQTDAYNQFITIDIQKKYNYDGTKWNKRTQVYKPENDQQWFISLDLIKANYNSMQYVNPDLVLHTDNYRELMSQFTDDPYFLDSKYIRQVIFGNLNPKRQQHVQKYIMGQIDHTIIERCDIQLDWIDCSTADEITFRIPRELICEYKIKIIEATHNYLPQFVHMIRVDVFQLHRIKDTKYYVKEFEDKSLEFKGVPKVFFAQYYKRFKQLSIVKEDLIFEYEKQMCTFLMKNFGNVLM